MSRMGGFQGLGRRQKFQDRGLEHAVADGEHVVAPGMTSACAPGMSAASASADPAILSLLPTATRTGMAMRPTSARVRV